MDEGVESPTEGKHFSPADDGDSPPPPGMDWLWSKAADDLATELFGEGERTLVFLSRTGPREKQGLRTFELEALGLDEALSLIHI